MSFRYTLLVGKPPFETQSLKDTYQKIKRNDYRIPSYISHDARALIARLLQSEPASRPSPTDILQDPFLTGGYLPVKLPLRYNYSPCLQGLPPDLFRIFFFSPFTTKAQIFFGWAPLYSAVLQRTLTAMHLHVRRWYTVEPLIKANFILWKENKGIFLTLVPVVSFWRFHCLPVCSSVYCACSLCVTASREFNCCDLWLIILRCFV